MIKQWKSHKICCFNSGNSRKKAHTLAWSAFPSQASRADSLWSSGIRWFSPAFWPKAAALEVAKSSMPRCVSSLATRQWTSCQWSFTRSLPSTSPTTTEHCVPSWSRCWVWKAKRRWRLLWCTFYRAQEKQRWGRSQFHDWLLYFSTFTGEFTFTCQHLHQVLNLTFARSSCLTWPCVRWIDSWTVSTWSFGRTHWRRRLWKSTSNWLVTDIWRML